MGAGENMPSPIKSYTVQEACKNSYLGKVKTSIVGGGKKGGDHGWVGVCQGVFINENLVNVNNLYLKIVHLSVVTARCI